MSADESRQCSHPFTMHGLLVSGFGTDRSSRAVAALLVLWLYSKHAATRTYVLQYSSVATRTTVLDLVAAASTVAALWLYGSIGLPVLVLYTHI